MSELTADAVKLAKLGRVLAQVADGVAFMDNLEDAKSKLEKEVAAQRALLVSLATEAKNAQDAIASAKKQAEAIVQTSRERATTIIANGEAQAATIVGDATKAKTAIAAESDKITADIATLKKAREATDAAVKSAKEQEAEVLSRIAKMKEDAKRNLGL